MKGRRSFFVSLALRLFIGVGMLVSASVVAGRSKPTAECRVWLGATSLAVDAESETVLNFRPTVSLAWQGNSLDFKYSVFEKTVTIRGEAIPSLLFLAQDGSGGHEIPNIHLLYFGNIVWSPDAQYIAFVAYDPKKSGRTPLAVVANADGSQYHIVELPVNWRNFAAVSWSPDSAYVVIAHDSGLVSIRRSDLAVTQIASAPLTYGPFWSSSGHKIAYAEAPPIESLTVYDVDSGRKVDIPLPPMEGAVIRFEWSPDGRYLVAGRGTSTFAQNARIFRIEDDTAPVESPFGEAPITANDEYWWTADGTPTLLYIGGDQQGLSTYRLDTGASTLVLPDNANSVLSVKGQKLIISKQQGDRLTLLGMDLAENRIRTLMMDVEVYFRGSAADSGKLWAIVQREAAYSVISIDTTTFAVRTIIEDVPIVPVLFAMNSDFRQVAVQWISAGSESGLALYDPVTDSVTRYPLDIDANTEVFSVIASADRQFVAVSVRKAGEMSIQTAEREKVVVSYTLKLGTAGIMQADWFANNEKVLYTAIDGSVYVVRKDGRVIIGRVSQSAQIDWLPCSVVLDTAG